MAALLSQLPRVNQDTARVQASTVFFLHLFLFLFCQAHHCGAFIPKHPSIVTIFLSFTHSHVFVWFSPHMYILQYASSRWLQKKFWNYIERYTLITFDIQTHLNVVDVLFGIKQHNYGKVKTKPINLLPQCKQGSRVWLHFAVRHLLTRRSLVRNRQSQSMTVVKETLKRSEKWQLPCFSFRTWIDDFQK